MRGLGKDSIQIKKISTLLQKSNKRLIAINLTLLTCSIYFFKNGINHKIPIPQIGKAKDSFKLVEEAKRLSIEEVNIATNYGFKTASLLMDRGDNKIRPQVIIDDLGTKRYRYIATKGEKSKTREQVERDAEEIEKTISTSRKRTKNLLKILRDVGVTVAIGNPGKAGAAAVWNPRIQTIKISREKMEEGSQAVLRVLNHEGIHVAQSCKNGGINYKPIPLGLKLSPTEIYKTQIGSKIYEKSSKKVKKLEKEAYSYEFSNRATIYLIEKECGQKRAL